jgi:uncharacterized repeat protein (TIGR03806 family)
MSGCGPAVDGAGNLYLVTGNGTSDVTVTGTPPLTFPGGNLNFGEAIIKFSPTLTVLDYFTPWARVALNTGDADLGVGGLVLLPPLPSGGLNVVIHDSKEGRLYVENRANLGQYINNGPDAIIQESYWFGSSQVKATPIYWTDHNLTLHVIGAAENSNPIKAFTVSSSGLLTQSAASTNLDATTSVSLTQMALSCNGTTASSGVLWLMSPTVADPIHQFGPGILRAYNADTLVEIYNSTQNSQRDALGYWPKNCAPLVANGKVYVASLSNLVYVYGLVPVTAGLTVSIASPQTNTTTAIEPVSITVNAVASSFPTTVAKVDFFAGTTPIGEVTSASGPYTINWTPVYGGTYSITALVTDSVNATAISAPVIVTVPGRGTGAIELQTYTGPNSIAGLLADGSYPNAPDAVGGTTFPTTASGPMGTGLSNYGNRLIGYVYPPISGSYLFWIASDDASELFLSTDATPGHQVQIASVTSYTGWQDWNNASNPTQQSALIPLVAGQRYFIQALHVQGGGGDNLDVGWQLPDGPALAPGTFERPIKGVHLSPPTLAPKVSPRADSYSGPITVTMTSPIPGQAIYYTINGAAPTTGSTLYSGSFVVSTVGTTTIRAVSALVDTSTPACPVGTVLSPVTTTAYTITGSTAYGVASLPPTGGNSMPTSLATNPPPHLSGTGLFSVSTAAGLAPAAGVLPYTVIAPLWSDGATKSRWIALPAGGQITFAATGEFTYPAGTVMIKNFVLNGTPVEIRMLVLNGPNAGYGVTYKWNAGGTDADLMGPSTLPVPLSDGADQTIGSQSWHFPSRAECLQCHTAVANFVLGPKTRQLNTSFAYPGGATDNQLRTWNYLQMFSTDIGEGNISGFAKLTNISDASAGTTLQDRVRSYVDANCAQCHRPGSGLNSYWDARFDTVLANQGIVDGIVQNTLGIVGAEVVRPLTVNESLMHVRMNTVDPTIRMPPLARNVIDTTAVGVLDAWIGSLPPSSATVPVQPSGLVATVVSDTEIDLAWTNNANNQTGFVIQAMVGSGGTFTQIAGVPGSTFTFNDTGLSGGTQYSFQVAASNGAGPSTYSNIATATTTGTGGSGSGAAAATSSGGGGHCGFGAAAAGLLLLIWAMRRNLMG